MSKAKATRSSSKSIEETLPPKTTKVQALRKVFYVPEKLLDGGSLRLERFHHPGKGKSTWFITNVENHQIMEVLEFVEPRRSWLIDNEVCSNGRLYLAAPIDVTFLVLHHLRKHCTQKALALESISDAQDSSTLRLLTTFGSYGGAAELLSNVADVKTAGAAEGNFYKYNAEKTLAWLSLKSRCVAETLRRSSVHCGHSALSLNYTRSETLVTDENVQQIDYLRMACDIVGGYIDLELHEELKLYLQIPMEVLQFKVTDKQVVDGTKRKSSGPLNSGVNKKLKLDTTEAATKKLKDSGLLNKSAEDDIKPIRKQHTLEIVAKPSPLREHPQTAKEKALAKGAKGTKSIASFFKK